MPKLFPNCSSLGECLRKCLGVSLMHFQSEVYYRLEVQAGRKELEDEHPPSQKQSRY